MGVPLVSQNCSQLKVFKGLLANLMIFQNDQFFSTGACMQVELGIFDDGPN